MHIPDGYLGPLTCAVFYIIMIPIWILAFRKARDVLEAREIPMLSLLSAFSFLVMMFNWPVPDGTTAHMVGGALIATLLGPYAAVIAVSIALLIQALLFGDGGITTFGANCFNMAFILPFTAYLILKLSHKLIDDDKKASIIGSFIGGYVGLNIAAFFCGLEIGIQPFIQKGYCPYPYWLSIPAMLFAHLTVAGWIEAFVTMAVVSYLYSSNPEYLRLPKITPSILRLVKRWLYGI